jgi:hypothetical protein
MSKKGNVARMLSLLHHQMLLPTIKPFLRVTEAAADSTWQSVVSTVLDIFALFSLQDINADTGAPPHT